MSLCTKFEDNQFSSAENNTNNPESTPGSAGKALRKEDSLAGKVLWAEVPNIFNFKIVNYI